MMRSWSTVGVNPHPGNVRNVTDRRRLMGVSEIAELLGVSKQRASVLCNQKGFPEPVQQVIPVDDETRQALVELYAKRTGKRTFSADGTWDLFSERSFVLPDTPRLWRQSSVEEWAKEHGRELLHTSRDGKR
jgi:hypothetical protein